MAASNTSRPCTIVLHDDRVSEVDVLGGTDILPVGSVARLSTTGKHDILIVSEGRAAGQKDISLHVRLGTKFGFGNRMSGRIVIVEDEDQVTASHIDLFFRDQYLSRTDMWLMTKQLEGRVIYKDSQVRYLGHDVAVVRDIHMHGQETRSALVQQGRTKAIVRCGSAHFTILVQLSNEMLEYNSAGNLMYEELIEGFLTELFQRWEDERARHLVSLVIFGRRQEPGADSTKDFYHVLHLDTPSARKNDLLTSLKQAFNDVDLPQCVSLATSGNLLEAIHVSALDFLQSGEALHLASTGASIIAITAGAGAFLADYLLLRKTTHILLGHSIGVALVSLAVKPAHPVPLFKYKLDNKYEYALPHWADISYWNSEHGDEHLVSTRTLASNRTSDIALPALQLTVGEARLSPALFDQFDQNIFDLAKADNAVLSIPLVYPSTSVESSKTVKASPPPTNTSAKLPTPLPPLKQRLSSSSITTTISLSKQARPSGSSILSSRKISLGPRGLAPLKSSAITTISEAHANHGKDSVVIKFAPDEGKSGLANQIRASLNRRPSQSSMTSRFTDPEEKVTQPIDIQKDLRADLDATIAASADSIQDVALSKLTRSSSKTPKAFDGMASSPHQPSLDPGAEARTPWLTLVNPCNIKKDNMRIASRYRQWQHVFPRAIDSAEFKWTSMCTPASLPLYNDLFPSAEDLKKYYKRTTRRMICSQPDGSGQRPHDLLKQLVTLRLAHGFQIVARPHTIELSHVTMSIGADYHELQCLSELELEIVEYTHDSTNYTNTSYLAEGYSSTFDVVSMHNHTPVQTSANFAESELLLDWSAIDQSIDSSQATDSLYRMRFVLLPVDIPKDDETATTEQRELADDEKRIDGIQRLTQQWQRHRALNPEDLSHQVSIARKKGVNEVDQNPLAIDYHTRDPSALVNSQDVAVSGQLNGNGPSIPLFQESERYHSSNFDLTKLVRQMQEPPPQGVELRDRRWFARIHLRCFRGDEMTNWLLGAFKDLKTREEAVDIGNVLMDRGVFTHVRHKHAFRDGNYFYQIAQAHRTIEYPNAIASVFNRGAGRSIPPTPSTEVRMSPQVRPTRGESDSTGPDSSLLAPVERKQVLLSQSLRYNVDPGRRSQQEEVINVHYDRIHNPENCYHIYIDWTLTTPMLIREAINKWAALVEPYGLRLTQLPWLEASAHAKRHPFEQPQYVKLVIDPPDRIPSTPQFGSLYHTARVIEDRQFYYKAILRKLGFVLDEESADSFSSKLEVLVTWGTIDFSMTQLVHKSGLVIAQISNSKSWDFLLLPNYLAADRTNAPSRVQPTDTVDKILADVQAFAEDAEALKRFYDEADKPRMVAPSPFNRAALAGADLDVPPMQLPPLILNRGN